MKTFKVLPIGITTKPDIKNMIRLAVDNKEAIMKWYDFDPCPQISAFSDDVEVLFVVRPLLEYMKDKVLDTIQVTAFLIKDGWIEVC